MLKKLGVLEPGKIYVLQIDYTSVDWSVIESTAQCLAEQGIKLIVINKDMSFVSVPEGYKLIKDGSLNSM